MSEPKKKPGVAFWATVTLAGLFAALVLYALSIPVVALLWRLGVVPGRDIFESGFYDPLRWLLRWITGYRE